MVIAGVPFAIYIACDIMLALSGAGKPEAQRTFDDNIDIIKWSFISQLLWCWCLILIKSSIAFALCRATLSHRYVYSLYATVVIFTIPLLMAFVTLLLSCQPVSFLWDKSDPHGYCRNAKFADVLVAITYTFGACNIATDWFCALLAILILWCEQVQIRMKFAVGVIIALGMLASVSSVIRLALSLHPTNPAYIPLAIYSYAEPALGLTAGCLSALRPLFRFLREPARAFSPSQENLTGGAWRSDQRRAHARQRTEFELAGGWLGMGVTETYIRRSSGATELQLASEKGGKGLQRGISVTRRFEVS